MAYNSTILDSIYLKMIADGVSQEILDTFARISPIAWIHLLFTGRYSFKKIDGNIDISEMAREIERHLKQCFWRESGCVYSEIP